MSSAIHFSLDQSKILLSGNGLHSINKVSAATIPQYFLIHAEKNKKCHSKTVSKKVPNIA